MYLLYLPVQSRERSIILVSWQVIVKRIELFSMYVRTRRHFFSSSAGLVNHTLLCRVRIAIDRGDVPMFVLILWIEFDAYLWYLIRDAGFQVCTTYDLCYFFRRFLRVVSTPLAGERSSLRARAAAYSSVTIAIICYEIEVSPHLLLC